MVDVYVGEIRYFPYMRGAPSGWLVCDGSMQPTSQYDLLYALIGNAYGGDSSNFALPDLRGRVPIGVGPSNPLGSQVGQEQVTLSTTQLPNHGHYIEASTATGTATDPTGQVFAGGGNGSQLYVVTTTGDPDPMNSLGTGSTGQGGAHSNCAPTLPILACIAWAGAYPTPS